MPLNNNTLVNSLSKFMDEESSLFTGFPSSQEIAANDFLDALVDYMSEMVTPVLPTGVPLVYAESAKASLLPTLVASMDKATMQTVCMNFANLFAVSMASTYTSTAPIVPPTIDFSEVEILGLQEEGTSDDCAQEIAETIHEWFTNWVSVMNVSPFTNYKWG